MRISYDPQADAMYIYMNGKNKTVKKTEPIRDDLMIDFGKNGELLGIEILDVSEKMQKPPLKSVPFERISEKPTRLLQ